jgi:hypothetical protein
MTEDFSSFIETHRSSYEAGRLAAGYEAALFCIANRQAIPEWLAPMVEAALKRDFVTSEGRGRGGFPAITASNKAALRQFIRAEVDRMVLIGRTKIEAFELVANDLSRHSVKLWTTEMVKAEYYKRRKGVAAEGL